MVGAHKGEGKQDSEYTWSGYAEGRDPCNAPHGWNAHVVHATWHHLGERGRISIDTRLRPPAVC